MPRWMDAWLIGLSIGFMVLTVAGVWWPDALLKNSFLNDAALASVLIFGAAVAACDLLWRKFRKR